MPTPTRTLPPHPHFDQLKRQAKELLDAFRAGDATAIAEVAAHYRGAESTAFALHDAQLVLARAYGFDSWPKLKAFVDGATGPGEMIKPVDLDTADGRDTWDTIVAASAGDVETLRRLLERDPRLARATYWYAPAVHFAVREGHLEAVRLLLDTGADPERNGLNDRNLSDTLTWRPREQPIAPAAGASSPPLISLQEQGRFLVFLENVSEVSERRQLPPTERVSPRSRTPSLSS